MIEGEAILLRRDTIHSTAFKSCSNYVNSSNVLRLDSAVAVIHAMRLALNALSPRKMHQNLTLKNNAKINTTTAAAVAARLVFVIRALQRRHEGETLIREALRMQFIAPLAFGRQVIGCVSCAPGRFWRWWHGRSGRCLHCPHGKWQWQQGQGVCSPTPAPTLAPSSAPSPAPTAAPSPSPSPAPTAAPSSSPTASPSNAPTPAPAGCELSVWGEWEPCSATCAVATARGAWQR